MRVATVVVRVAVVLVLVLVLVLVVYRSLALQRQIVLLQRENAPYKLSYHPANAFPKVIYQTFHDKSLVPQKVSDQFKKFAPDYRRVLWDDDECHAFIHRHFGRDVARRFTELQGCFRADLFRYCVLYVNGGIYMDIKTELIRPVGECFPDRSKLCLILTENEVHGILIKTIYQGILACPAGHPLMLHLIDFIMRQDPVFYHRYVKDCYDKFHGLFFTDNNTLLLEEHCVKDGTTCNGLDRYSLCCFVVDRQGNKLFKVRFNEYPWKK